ncbi:MAG: tetratricopeptide repeat protein [Nibricoccus sp.]
MSVCIERALLLMQQSRLADAERELMLALSEDPQSSRAHAYLALCQVDLEKKDDALKSAQAAIGLVPDESFGHYVHALVLHRIDKDKEALAAVQEAIRLEPENEAYFALLASTHLALRDWQAALTAAEQGLALNPEDVQCANLRSMALVRLGRKEEAMATVSFALERDPDSALSHANQGWNCLHRNDPRRAQDHFREALRIDPELEYARQGMLEALKARNPVYRGMLAYFLWMGRQSGQKQWAFIVGAYFGSRFVRMAAETNPQLAPFLWPLLILFYLFIYLSWTAVPMFNLLLRLDRFGRYVLSHDERVATNWFGLCLLPAIGSLVAWPITKDLRYAFGAAVCAVLSICVSITFARTARKRAIFATATAVMAAIGLGGIGLLFANLESGFDYLTAFFVAFLALQIAANFARR